MLPNLTPGVTYEVTIVSVKGQRESEPGSDSVTTGRLQSHEKLAHVHTHTNVCFGLSLQFCDASTKQPKLTQQIIILYVHHVRSHKLSVCVSVGV